MAIRAGQLRHRVELQTLSGSTVADSRGHSQKSFLTVDTVRAKIEYLSGTEGILAKQLFPKATHRVLLRFSSQINEQARLKFNGRFLNIESVERVDEKLREMWLICAEDR